MTTFTERARDLRSRARWHLQHHRFDRRYGVDTDRAVDLATLGLADDERRDYVASDWRTLSWVLDPTDVTPDDVFLDLGAGKGRMLVAAASGYDFGRVLGVELSDDLAATAAENLTAAERRLRCREAWIEVADATTYRVGDDVTVVYLFNPFVGETFRQVAANIHASLLRAPRRLRLIYRNPVEDRVLREFGFRTVRAAMQGPEHNAVLLYEHLPAAPPAGTSGDSS